MFSPAAAHLLLIAIVAISIVCMLVRPRGIAEVYWVGAGALLLIVLRLIPLRLAGHAVAEGMDVYLFLTGMMVLSELARVYGVFDWLASVAVHRARGSRVRLFMLMYGVGTLVTIFLSNDATAVVLTPAVLSAVRKSKAEPLPYLFACALIANAASFVLPISNPANLVVFRNGMPSLPHWLASFALPSLLAIVATYWVLRWYFRRELKGSIDADIAVELLSGDGRLVLVGILSVAGVLLAASAMDKDLGLPTCISAIVIAAIVSIKARANPGEIVRDISWSVLPLVAGLFILVEAMSAIGALRYAQAALVWVQHLPSAVGVLLTVAVVGVGNNVVNNLPLGLIAGSTITAAHAQGLIVHTILIAVDLGPNLSVTGSLATILWLVALRREGLHVSFGRFLRVGLVAMPIALGAATVGAFFMRWVMGRV
ncbi:SLC13 family permease [Granulicella arctica]|uniref:Arsenical pump membrane protein n=1 Tax=Granulicella arctica TaxID=940613 RepID=A0A7Y9TG11_9BACT|nr:SLC13 family permease [Granulicella arctica]NYF78220.1 arsenical pump membrane protein [Granulicella arctica]